MTGPAANSGPPAIAMRDLSVGAMKDPRLTVAENVNWTVNTGEFWLVAGAQLSGKSDFLMMTAGLMSPARGTYRFFDGEMPIFEEERLSERLRLGLVFEGGRLFNRLTVAENVALPLRYHKDRVGAEVSTRLAAMLEMTGLTPMADRTPGSLARNWQRRAGLARALALQPEVLLLDNPIVGLDARHSDWWLDFLGRLARGQTALNSRPMTIVATTDEPGAWRGHAQHVACLVEKRLLVLGGWPEADQCRAPGVQDVLSGKAGGN